MSGKRILGIAVFGIAFVAAAIGIMLIVSFLGRDESPIPLPQTSMLTTNTDGESRRPDALDLVLITRDTVQAVVATLTRPEAYTRDVQIETFWQDGQATHKINVSVLQGVTALRIEPPIGFSAYLPGSEEKRIILSSDTQYIWYSGDAYPHISTRSSLDDGFKAADEWQMLVTYEDLLEKDINYIVEAGYNEFGGVDCIYAQYRSPLLGNTMKYYVSIELGLIIYAEEHDVSGALIYSMTAGECIIGEVDLAAFTLPDGTVLIQ